MKKTPVTANPVLSCLRKMFNMAEVWGVRDDSTNPRRHIPKYPENGKTRLIADDEMARLFGYLERADVERLEHPFLTLGIRLQFAFAARMSEIINMEWDWVDFVNRRVVWPDSKTGEMSKPMSEDVVALLSNAPRLDDRSASRWASALNSAWLAHSSDLTLEGPAQEFKKSGPAFRPEA